MSLNLIDKALEYSKEARISEQTVNDKINEPLFPEAKRSVFYLRVRENINRGCRKAVKLISENWKRSIAYSVLIEACYDIFHYGYNSDLIAYYNRRLDEIIGTH
jgi:hypothetical protein